MSAFLLLTWSSSIDTDGKVSARNAGDLGLIPGSGRSPGEGNGNPLQYSCLENSTDRSLIGYSPWGRKESDTTEGFHFHCHLGSRDRVYCLIIARRNWEVTNIKMKFIILGRGTPVLNWTFSKCAFCN